MAHELLKKFNVFPYFILSKRIITFALGFLYIKLPNLLACDMSLSKPPCLDIATDCFKMFYEILSYRTLSLDTFKGLKFFKNDWPEIPFHEMTGCSI